MKKTVLTFLAAAISLSASAQLLLTYNNAAGQLPGSVVIKTDMINSILISGGGLPNFAPANNMHWDLSNVIYKAQVRTVAFDTSTSPFFTPAKYSSEVVYNNTGGLPYVTNLKFEIRSTGMFTYGEHLDRQAFPLGFVTTDPADSLVILDQDIDYSANVQNMPYPMAANISFWNNTFSYNTNMELTYNAQGYSQAPIVKVSHVTTLDSAIGWGTISGKCLDNAQGDEVDVVQVKNITVIVDSFYNLGVPMPANVLSTFGLSQGQVSNVYQYNWYRAGEVTAMLNVVYNDAQFSNIHDINFHRERMPYHTGVSTRSAINDMVLYPNPATNRISISLSDKAMAACGYELMSVTGQVVATGNVTSQAGNINIDLGNIPAGTYYISISNNGQLIGRSPLSVLK